MDGRSISPEDTKAEGRSFGPFLVNLNTEYDVFVDDTIERKENNGLTDGRKKSNNGARSICILKVQ